jgi:hypothetical protein
MKNGMDSSLLFERLISTNNQYLGPGKRHDKGELISIILEVAIEEYITRLNIDRKIKEWF